MKFLLTYATSSLVKGGTEIFSTHLKKTFPDLTVLDYHTIRSHFSGSLPFLKEPLSAKRLTQWFLTQIPEIPDTIFTNGMFGWNLNVPCPVINIQHGTYAALAEHALKKSSLNYWRTRYIYSHYERLSAKKATKVIANSRLTQQFVKKFYMRESTVIHNAIDIDNLPALPKNKARKSLSLPEGMIGIFVGRPDYAKGFDIIEHIASMRENITFLCITPTPFQPRHKNIIPLSNIPHEKLTTFYSAADFCINPSRFDGFGYVPLESLACNTPVLTNKVGVFNDMDIEGSYIVRKNTPDEYDRIISNLPEKTQSRAFIRKTFSFRKFKRNYRSLL